MIDPAPILPVTDTVFAETLGSSVASIYLEADGWHRLTWQRNWGIQMQADAALKETEREMLQHGFHPLRFTGGMIRYGVPF